MNLSPQSAAIIQRLLAKRPVTIGKLTIGPLQDPAATLLTVLVNHYDELSRMKGEERARKLRDRFDGHTAVGSANQTTNSADSASPFPITPVPSPQWRLVNLRCVSIRGIAPTGESFEFSLDNQSCLIYGPNGSGKSSLLSAITWVLTGLAIVDTATPADQAPLYSVSSGKTSGAKVRDWPIMATLPGVSNLAKASADCRAELLIERPSDHARLWLGRSYGAPLQASTDGQTWTPLTDVGLIGIAPLDIQLSLIAPTVFGRRSIEEADNTRSILSLMLGFDDLELLGELASQLSTNRTKLANIEKKEIEAKVSALRSSLGFLPTQLPEGADSAKVIAELAVTPELTVAHFEKASRQLNNEVTEAESHLARTLGLPKEDSSQSGGLADRLTVAIDRLAKGFDFNFPSLAKLRLVNALPEDENGLPSERLDGIAGDFEKFRQKAQSSIASRCDWWLKENAAGSKCSLLLKAAQYYDPENGDCPVCDRRIDDPVLREHLESLKKLDTTAGTELRTFFNGLAGSLAEIVPQALTSLSSKTVRQYIDDDWTDLCVALLQGELTPAASALEEKISASKAKAEEVPTADLQLLPEICEEAFRVAASPFVKAMKSAQIALALLHWSRQKLSSLCDEMHAYVTDGGVPTSLLGQLAKGKAEAALVKPLVTVYREIEKFRKDQETIDNCRSQLKILEDLADPLDQLKLLSKYAETVVQSEFEAIKGVTASNLKYLYPETSMGIRPGNLRLGKGRDKTVEALLTSATFEAPGRYFANAGLQRAIALAFYFALLEKHTGGIGFILMDDPILSLDEDHRERWAVNLLRPKLNTMQVILATHQRVFLRHCAHDFVPGRVVELNPRARHCRISCRPGARLQRATQQLNEEGDWLGAAITMRKFREDVLISLDAYCNTVLFDPGDLAGSAGRYQQLPPNHPLAGEAQLKICERLKRKEVGYVLDPAAHSMTEADVTRSMVEDCLPHLTEISTIVTKELTRLDTLRLRSLRSTVIDVSAVPFGKLEQRVMWAKAVSFSLVGASAAKSHPWSIELSTNGENVQMGPGGAVQVTDDMLEPVARFGQWVLLAEEGTPLNDGDLVAVHDENDGRYLRRLWSDERQWILQSVNPNCPAPSLTMAKRLLGIRKIIGVIYRPLGVAKRKAGGGAEWLPCASLDAAKALGECRVIEVAGDSLSPLARNGQKLLVDQPLANPLNCPAGEIAVVEFANSATGSVVKQVFPAKDRWTLVSPNLVDRLPPMLVSPKGIRAVWIVRGVLFDTLTT